ncbi:hypothetical protein ACOME3_005269 [Neoechinorhynchus agilis]
MNTMHLAFLFLTQGLMNVKCGNSTGLASDLPGRWITNNYQTFKSTSNMYEKYNAVTPGYHGEGAEYDAQAGFGRTNGVAPYNLSMFGHRLVNKPPFDYRTATIVLGVVSGLLGIILLSILYVKIRIAMRNMRHD